MAKIREKDRNAIMNAIAGGVTPRQGIQHIQVGRKEETKAILNDLEQVKAGGGGVRFIASNFGGGKSFFLTLCKTVALKQNIAVMTADMSPDRRLYSSSGQALNLYRECIRSLSTPMHPDGGALEEIIEAIDEKVMSLDNISEFRQELQRMPYGYDAWTVCQKWHQAKNPITDKEKRDANMTLDACLRWFAAEAAPEQRRLLGVKSLISDDGTWNMMKLLAVLIHFAGYAGLFIEYDECVNLYKITNTTSRERNYEVLLNIYNDCLQGDAKYLGTLFSFTPDALMNPTKGCFSYSALSSRLQASEYAAKNEIDVTSPVIDLLPLQTEDVLVLLGNLTNVEAYGNKEDWLVTDEDMRAYLEKQMTTLGSEIKSPRELTRGWIALLRTMRDNPELSFGEVLGTTEVKVERKSSGLGAAMMDDIQPNNSMIDASDADEEDFGF